MSILIFGATGMLGHKLYQTLAGTHKTYATLRRTYADVARFGIFSPESIVENVDVTDLSAVRRAFEAVEPDVVINAVGLIKQLPASLVVENALSVNSIFPHRLTEFAAEYGLRLITLSTDCVFDGTRGNYADTDEPDARDLYGISKSLGEVSGENVLTLRTSIIGRELDSRNSIVEWFLSHRGGSVDGYRRALYSGLTTIEFSRIVGRIIEDFPHLNGVYNLSSEPVSKFELLQLLNDAFEARVRIVPNDDVVIDRTLDSSQLRRLIGYEPPAWRSMIGELAADTTPYERFNG